MGTITGDKESATVDLVDHPLIDPSALRVAGPFEVMSIGRYSDVRFSKHQVMRWLEECSLQPRSVYGKGAKRQ